LLRKYLKCGVNKSLMSRSILTGKGILRGGWKAAMKFPYELTRETEVAH